MEIIDKLFLELSHCTTAKTQRELELEDSIKRAIRISALWRPHGEWDIEHADEARALNYMYQDFCNLVGHPIE